MACPNTHRESLQIQIYTNVPHPCVLYVYNYLVLQMRTVNPNRAKNCTAIDCRVFGRWLKHSSKHSNRTPGLASDYQLPSIRRRTRKRPCNVRIGQINTFFRVGTADTLKSGANISLSLINRCGTSQINAWLSRPKTWRLQTPVRLPRKLLEIPESEVAKDRLMKDIIK